MIPDIQKGSEEFVQAMNTGNIEKLKVMLPTAVFEGKVEDFVSSRTQGMRLNGFRLASNTVGVPGPPQKVDDTWVSFVPERIELAYDDGGNVGQMRLFGPTHVTLDMYIVAYSTNGGKSWNFFEAESNRSITEQVLPKVASKLVFPAPMTQVTKN